MGMVKYKLLETPNFEIDDYGVPVPIWIGSDQYAKHKNPRIKLMPSQIPVQITPTGIEININSNDNISNTIDKTDFKKLATWMITNRDIISSYHYVVTNPTKYNIQNLNEILKIALQIRYEEIQNHGYSQYSIPFHITKPYHATFDNNINIDTKQYTYVLPNLEKKIVKETNEQINEMVYMAGIEDF